MDKRASNGRKYGRHYECCSQIEVTDYDNTSRKVKFSRGDVVLLVNKLEDIMVLFKTNTNFYFVEINKFFSSFKLMK